MGTFLNLPSMSPSGGLLSTCLLMKAHHIMSDTLYLCCPSFQFHCFSYHLTSPSFSCLQSDLYILPFILPCCLFSHRPIIPLSLHHPPPSLLLLHPCCPLPSAPDLLSLCLITKSTGSSRRSCRRSSPSVRSSLTRVRGTILAWRSFRLCMCVHLKVEMRKVIAHSSLVLPLRSLLVL